MHPSASPWLIRVLAGVLLLCASAFAQNSNFDLIHLFPWTEVLGGRVPAVRAFSDAGGNVYLVGFTTNAGNFPATAGALTLANPIIGGTYLFIQKFNAGGSVIAAALVARADLGFFDAKVDSQGNIYIGVFASQVSGVSNWTNGTAIVKVNSQMNQVVYATQVSGTVGAPIALDLDSDGSVVTAAVVLATRVIQVTKLSPAGSLSSFSYQLSESSARPTTLTGWVWPSPPITASLWPRVPCSFTGWIQQGRRCSTARRWGMARFR
jgi:hypothetical protein